MIDRASLIQNRKQISARETKNKAIADGILPFFQDAKCAGLYLPVRGEADIVACLDPTDTPDRVYPCVLSKTEMKFYRPVHMRKGFFSILEPEPIAENEAVPDVIVVPMLAFCGPYHIGYGGGYYDRYLSTHPQSLRVGIAFDEQEIKAEPQPWDEPLDALVIPSKTVIFLPLRESLFKENKKRLTCLLESSRAVGSDRSAFSMKIELASPCHQDPDRK